MVKLMRELPLLQALADAHRRVLLEPGLPPLHQDTGADHRQAAVGGLPVASDTELVNAHRTQVLAQVQQAKP